MVIWKTLTKFTVGASLTLSEHRFRYIGHKSRSYEWGGI